MDPNMPSPASSPPSNNISSYPAPTKQAAGHIDGLFTDVTCTSFSDKIMLTITQEGRLAQWVRDHAFDETPTTKIFYFPDGVKTQIHVPLGVSNPTSTDQYLPSATADDSLLPMTHLTPKTLLGGSNAERETIGQLYAAQIASIIATNNPHEKRTVLLGLGLSKFEASRAVFYDTIDLVRKCI
ncbi:MAG: hypothetical protein LQ348_006941 [Seirophora lacunosa]|nr:MAG: hypothetical protein LQ348_006941 [Seirophora lacunosa]